MFHNRLGWLLLIFIIIIVILFVGSLITYLKKSKKILDPEDYQLIRKPILLVGYSGIGIIGLIFICLGPLVIPLLVMGYQNEIVSCLELPVSKDVKFTIEDRRNGSREVNLVEVNGRETYIWSITQYTRLENYIIGETSVLAGYRDFFWFDINTKKYFDTRGKSEFDSREEVEFLKSLNQLGISKLPVLISVESLCKNGECIPCVGPSAEH